VIQAPAGTVVAIDIKSSNVRLESLQIGGAMWGIYAGAAGTQYTNLTLKGLTVTAVAGANPGHAIYVRNFLNAVVDANTVQATKHGINVDAESTGALVINNTVTAAGDQGIALTGADSAVVAGNTIAGAHQFGISINGCIDVRVERNTITTGVKQDGIVVTDYAGRASQSIYIGRNTVTSDQFTAGNPEGTGIWLNNQSNGTLVYGNTTAGAPENGLTIFNTSNSWFWGNTTTANGHGGIFIYGPTDLPYSYGAKPENVFLQGNYAHTLEYNAGIFLRDSSNVTTFNNAVRNAPAGIFLQDALNSKLFLNLLRDTAKGIHALANATGDTYFLNRHVTSMPNYAEPTSSVTYHGGATFGGNFQVGGKVLTDAYPYGVETLGRAPSVTVLLPAASSVVSAGLRKTIEWRSTGCTHVDLYYKPSAGAQQLIVANYPDTGIYQWTVPPLTTGTSYTIVIDCKNTAGTSLGVSGSSPESFIAGDAGIELLAPQGNHRITAGQTVKVAWKRAVGVTGLVTVQYRSSPGGSLTTLISNVAGNEATVTVPADGASEGQFRVSVAGTSIADATDGFVSVRDATPTVSGPTGTLGVGTLQLVQWQSHTNSYYVDIEYWDTTSSTYRTLAANVPDHGRFYFLVPDKTMTNAHLRVRFKSRALSQITTANSAAFNTAVVATPGDGGGNTTPAAPTVGTISPAGGTGATQTFTVTYTDTNGATDITTAFLMINPTIDGASSCFIEYNRATNTFRLMGDNGSTWSATIAAGSGSRSNSKCTINGVGAGATASGNTLTVTFPVTFVQAAPLARNTYGLAIDTANLNSGWKTLGTWNIPAAQAGRPEVISLSPTSGSGASGTFTAVFRHPNGAPTPATQGHYLGYILFLPTPNVVSFNAQGTCLIEYNRISNGMRLINNAGNNWIGPPEGVLVAPSTAPLSNNACTVNVAGVTAVLSGTDMTVTVPVTFNAANVTATLATFIQENDVNDNWTDFRQFGNWTVPGAPLEAGPNVLSATPTSGAGNSMTLTATMSHSGGASQLGEIHIRFNTTIVGGSPCHAVYFATNNTIALINDAGTALVGPVALGNPLSTSRCNLAAGATRSMSGNNLVLNLPFTFSPAHFAGAKNTYINAFDLYGAVTHWVKTGTWTVQ
jgi:parallel beta-helix repeat protein